MEGDTPLDVNVTELWHKYLFQEIMKIQEYERIARDGAGSIEATFEIPSHQIPLTQFNILRQLITELDILLSNTTIKLDENWCKEVRKEVQSAKIIVELHSEQILKRNLDEQTQRSYYQVTEKYWKILNKLQEIREQLVNKLSDILYGKANDDRGKRW